MLNHQLVSRLRKSSRIVDGIIGQRPPRNAVLSGASTLSKLAVDLSETYSNKNSPSHTVASMPRFVISDVCVLSSLDWELALMRRQGLEAAASIYPGQVALSRLSLSSPALLLHRVF